MAGDAAHLRPVSVRDLSTHTRGNAVSLASLLAVTLLAAAPSSAAPNGDAVQPVQARGPAPAKSSAAEEPAPTRLTSGHKAPDFQYQSYDQLWQNLHNFLEHGDVLLVFGASDVDLRTLERERESLVKGGVLPLAVVEKADREVWASVRRLGLTYSLMADPRGAIGTVYGVYDPSLGHSITSWFFIDRRCKVRSSGIGISSQGWLGLASNAFGRPFAPSTQATSAH